MKILIVEDEFIAASNYRKYLEEKDYVCDICDSVKKAKILLKEYYYDLIILDLNLEDGSGDAVVDYLKQNNIDTLVLVVSANSTDDSIVKLISNGADDYIVKPVNLTVLEVKIKALLRHKEENNSEDVIFNNFKFINKTSTLYLNDKEVLLSKKELVILKYLIKNHDILVTTEMLINSVYDQYYDTNSATLRVHIYNLKKKLNNEVDILVSYPKKGYKLCLDQLI